MSECPSLPTDLATDEDDPAPARFDRRALRESLERAAETGALARSDAGGFALPQQDARIAERTARNAVRWPYPCGKLLFLFNHVYGRSQVPWTCRNCYKVKVTPQKVTELVGVFNATFHKPYPSKFQSDIDHQYNAGFYGGYYYAEGLEQARAIYRDIRATLAAGEELRGVAVSIKRGCTEYEMHCGPSDQYEFPEELADIEQELLSLIADSPRPPKPASHARTFGVWIREAFRIGDESYLALTAGRRVWPDTVRYEP